MINEEGFSFSCDSTGKNQTHHTMDLCTDVWQCVLSWSGDVHDALIIRAVCKESHDAFRHVPLRVCWRSFPVLPALLCISPRIDHTLCSLRYADIPVRELINCVIDGEDGCAVVLNQRLSWNAEGRAILACAVLCREICKSGVPYVGVRASTDWTADRDLYDVFVMTRDGT